MDKEQLAKLRELKASGVSWDSDHMSEYKSALIEGFGLDEEAAMSALREFGVIQTREALRENGFDC